MIKAVYFSPTGGTEKITCAVAAGLGKDFEKIDITLPEARENPLEFAPGDTVVVGMPVYAGRVPNLIMPWLVDNLRGNGAMAVAVVVYGNRNYDHALTELRNILLDNGFKVAAAAAFVAEHSFSRILAADRPDGKDMERAGEFAAMAKAKLTGEYAGPVIIKNDEPVGPYYTPRDRQGNPVNILKVKPKTSDKCIKCGLCARKCPMGAISFEDPAQVAGICIKCGACEKKCPVGAKFYDDEKYIYHRTELELGYTRRAEPEMFV